MLEIGSLVDGKYKILNKVGQGGMSVVYLAMNEKANKQWAVKEVRKDGVLDFESVKQGLVAETDILKKLSHPNLPSIIDVIDTEDSFIITKTDDNGNVTAYEYLPTGAAQKYDDATPKYIAWTTSGDEHSFNINYADNADYVLEIEYTDLSTNDANISANDGNTATKSYKSKVVTVDKIAPVVDVKYSNEKIIHTIDGRDYFDAEQTATITVKEHNFRADDFVATVVAQDIVKADVNVEDFKATLSDDSKWTKNGNTYTITIKYSVDANYSFDYEYEDLAQNTAAAYDEDIFTRYAWFMIRNHKLPYKGEDIFQKWI